jgi:acetylornithine deacetylase/succinyl-diaminopimelate desuccinylase family protein
MTAVNERRVIEEARELVSVRTTTPPGEGELVEYFLDRFDESPVEFDVETQRIDSEDLSRQNVIARAGDPAYGTLLLTGHLDVVTAVESEWSVPPFDLTRHGDRLLGRGIADMKGALASMLLATEVYFAATDEPGEVVLGFVADEETGGLGTQEMVRRGIEADAAILGEPTNLTIGRANKGAARYDVTVRGESAHSGRPDKGTNAVSAVPEIIERLEALDDGLEAYTHELLVPRSTVTVTQLSGGTAPNIVPGEATVTRAWRFSPGMPTDPEWYDDEVETAIGEVTIDGVPAEVSIDRWNFKPAAGIDADEPVVQALEAALDRIGLDAEHTGFNAGTDAGYLIEGGIPTVLFGPGSIEGEAHTVDESMAVEELVTAVDAYERAIEAFFERSE